ncbi:hypothetical protein [Nonomuraea sp. NEAU-A123]|nr:hypothetical protein [Nonomuraea sp. NEAU-A123]
MKSLEGCLSPHVAKHEIHETSRWSLAEARVIWAALLSGSAR